MYVGDAGEELLYLQSIHLAQSFQKVGHVILLFFVARERVFLVFF